MTRQLKWAIAIWVVVNAMDVGTTLWGLSIGGFEVMPLAIFLLGYSPLALILYRIALTILVALAVYRFSRVKLLIIVIIPVALTTIWNTKEIIGIWT